MSGFKLFESQYPETLQLSRVSTHLSRYILELKENRQDVHLSEAQIKENYNFYKQDTDFNKVDAVVCSFPSSMCQAFIPLNKSIIFNPAHRYNINRCSLEESNRLNAAYDLLAAKSKLFAAGMSKYDQEYQLYYSGHK